MSVACPPNSWFGHAGAKNAARSPIYQIRASWRYCIHSHNVWWPPQIHQIWPAWDPHGHRHTQDGKSAKLDPTFGSGFHRSRLLLSHRPGCHRSDPSYPERMSPGLQWQIHWHKTSANSVGIHEWLQGDPSYPPCKPGKVQSGAALAEQPTGSHNRAKSALKSNWNESQRLQTFPNFVWHLKLSPALDSNIRLEELWKNGCKTPVQIEYQHAVPQLHSEREVKEDNDPVQHIENHGSAHNLDLFHIEECVNVAKTSTAE